MLLLRSLKFTLLAAFLLAFLPSSQLAAQDNPYDSARKIITDLNSIVSPEGVEHYFSARIGGIEQWLYVRGQNRTNPILLFVHGGPAAPTMPTAWQFQRPLEEYFTVVNWDQRGAGKTYREAEPDTIAQTLKPERYIADIIEVAQFLRAKYHQEKIILMAHSWGTIIGLQAAAKRPDLFYAYVGVGQVIDGEANEALSFDYGVQQAKAHNNQTALAELEAIAPYPGATPITRERIIIARKWPQFYGGLSAYRENSDYYFQGGKLSPQYTLEDLKTIDLGSQLTLDRVIEDILHADLTTITELPIPVVMFLGRHDYTTPTKPVVDWFEQLRSPGKQAVWFEHSAHMIPWEEPGKTLISLVNYVLPVTQQAKPKAEKLE